MNNPLITVYITNYNYEQFIEVSIQSVLSQTLQDFELIIIDDGSTDNSKEVIEKYRNDSRITIIYQQNKGLNITNNVAMRVSRGKYLIRLDADDFLSDTALEEMSDMLEQNIDLGLVFPDYYYVDAKGEVTGEERRHNFNKEVSLYDQPAHGACTMIRLSFLKKLGGYNESFTCQDGYDLWLKFVTHYTVANINKPLFSYRRHGKNLTTNEERILSTRKKIKETFVEGNFSNPKTLAIIPVRDVRIAGELLPLTYIGEKSLIEYKIEAALKSKKIEGIVVTTSSDEIFDFLLPLYGNNKHIDIIRRSSELSRPNVDLYQTVIEAVDYYESAHQSNIEAALIVTTEYIFSDGALMDESIDTLTLFKSDSVLSVRPDNRMFYNHTGHTLSPILDQDKFTKIERDALYRAAGGIMLTKKKSLLKSNKLISGKISHVIADERESFGVFSQFDLKIAHLLLS